MTEFAPGPFPNEAIPTLAVMWSNRTPVGFSTDMLFRAEDYGLGAFSRIDFPVDMASKERGYLYWVTNNMIELDLIEHVDERRGISVKPVKLYVATTALEEVTADYNRGYQETLAGILPKRLTSSQITSRAIGALGKSYDLPRRMEESSIIDAVSRLERISESHVMRRALRGLAAAHGKDDDVRRDIERRVREHPLATGGRRQRHRESADDNDEPVV
jgi:hypothetical protein